MNRTGTHPMIDYNNRAWEIELDFLKSQGFRETARSRVKIYIMHPDGDIKRHRFAGNFNLESKKLKLYFSPSILEAGRLYSASDLFTLRECSGDTIEATRRLRKMGYGSF